MRLFHLKIERELRMEICIAQKPAEENDKNREKMKTQEASDRNDD